jgi:hypothetical protein
MAVLNALGDRLGQPALLGLTVGMHARAIGAFQHQQVGVAQRRNRRAENRALRSHADIAGNHQPAIRRGKAQADCTSNMAGACGPDSYVWQLGDALIAKRQGS